MHAKVYITPCPRWQNAVERILGAADLPALVSRVEHILIKPNLVSTQPPPVTTPVALVEALVIALKQQLPGCRISIGEGTGATSHDTAHCFEVLGYTQMAARQGVELIDLNTLPLVRKVNPDCRRLPELYLPALLEEVFLLSVPVLKAHSLAGVTLSLKSMMGCIPPAHYRRGGGWGKSALHEGIDQAIADLNRYRTPDFTLLDCSVGMAESHLWGKHCDPPVGLLTASIDPVAIDSHGAQLLGRDWRTIGHIHLTNGILGNAESFEVVRVERCRSLLTATSFSGSSID